MLRHSFLNLRQFQAVVVNPLDLWVVIQVEANPWQSAAKHLARYIVDGVGCDQKQGSGLHIDSAGISDFRKESVSAIEQPASKLCMTSFCL